MEMRIFWSTKTAAPAGFDCLQFGAEAARGSDGVCAGCSALVLALLSNQSRPPASSKAAADDRTVCTPHSPIPECWCCLDHHRGLEMIWFGHQDCLEKPHLLSLKLTRCPTAVSVSCRRLLPPPGSKRDQERT